MDAIDLLTADHNRVRGLFEQFREAHDTSNDDQMALVAGRIVEELRVHTAIEEEVFYDAVQRLDEEIAETVAEGLEEHHVVDTLLDELSGVEEGSEEWVAKVTVIIESTEHHLGEEEDELFPAVRSGYRDVLEHLDEGLEQAKAARGAPTLDQKIDLTLTELQQLARDQHIPGRSSMDHEELAATVAPQ